MSLHSAAALGSSVSLGAAAMVRKSGSLPDYAGGEPGWSLQVTPSFRASGPTGQRLKS